NNEVRSARNASVPPEPGCAIVIGSGCLPSLACADARLWRRIVGIIPRDGNPHWLSTSSGVRMEVSAFSITTAAATPAAHRRRAPGRDSGQFSARLDRPECLPGLPPEYCSTSGWLKCRLLSIFGADLRTVPGWIPRLFAESRTAPHFR